VERNLEEEMLVAEVSVAEILVDARFYYHRKENKSTAKDGRNH
jgi:hypothetical protein